MAKICQTSLRMCHIQCGKAKKQEIYYLLHFMHRIENFIFHVPPSHVLYNNKLLIFSLKSERKKNTLHQNKSLAKAAPVYINYTCVCVCLWACWRYDFPHSESVTSKRNRAVKTLRFTALVTFICWCFSSRYFCCFFSLSPCLIAACKSHSHWWKF